MVRHRIGVWFAGLAVVLGAACASACSIPVFRYALERWQPDLYEVLVYHRGELTADEVALLTELRPESVPGEPVPNLAITRVDLSADRVRPEFAAIWAEDGGESLPWMIVRTPWKGENFTVWTGPLTESSIASVHQSPQRAELIRRLAGGDSIVWVFLDGSDAAESERLALSSQEQLRQLVTDIRLPEIRPEDLSSLSVDPASLGLRFSFLRLRADEPSESLLIRSLLAVRPGLTDAVAAGEPLLFPVFGRGRVFFPLVGAEISPINLEDLARFLSGACQCTIKEQNPGLDLLTTVDWDAYVLGIPTEKPLPPLAGLGDFTAPMSASTMPTPAGATTAASPSVASTSVSSSVPTAAARLTDTPATAAQSTAESIPSVSAAPSRRESLAPGGLALWMIGLLTGAVAIASLCLRARH